MAEFSIILGNKNYSSWSFRGWLALKLTGADFDEEVIPLDQPGTGEEIRRHSPSGRVPMLHHGEVGVWESLAIAEYLAETFPDAGLWPAGTGARAEARSISAEMHAGFPALRQGMPMNMRASLPGKGMAEGVQADINRITAIWRGCRERHGGEGDFLFGAFCIADAMYAPVASRFTTYGVELDETSDAYRQAVISHPAYVEWLDAARNEPWIIPREEL
jgi:glutathione S-transferase